MEGQVGRAAAFLRAGGLRTLSLHRGAVPCPAKGPREERRTPLPGGCGQQALSDRPLGGRQGFSMRLHSGLGRRVGGGGPQAPN